MTIRLVLDLTQMRPNTPIGTGQPIAQPGTPFLVTGQAGTSLDVSITDGWFKMSRPGIVGGTDTRCLAAYKKLDEITWTSATVAYGGVRVKANMTMSQMLCFIDSASYNDGTNMVMLFSKSDLPDGGVDGVEYYLEWGIDMPARKIYRRINGTQRLADITFPSGNWDNMMLAQRGCICVGYPLGIALATTTPCNISFRDMYSLEKSSDGLDSLWLGPRRVAPITVEEVIAPWTASDGTDAKTIFNKPITTAADLTTPVVTTDEDRTEGLVKLTTSAGGNINAVVLSHNARKPAGTTAGLRTQLELNGSLSASVFTSLDSVMANTRILMSTVGPDGLPWTASRLRAATLKVQASNN